jgi:hypothetical protein
MSNNAGKREGTGKAIDAIDGNAATASVASKAILVLGMHRSGTSAATRVLNFLGADLGPNLLAPGFSNDLGFWEHLDAYKINDSLLHGLGRSWNDVRPLPDLWTGSPQYARALHDIVEVLKRDFGHSRLWAVKDPRLCRLVPLWREALDQTGVEKAAIIVLRHPSEVAESLGVRDGLSREHVNLLWARHLLDAERTTRDMPRCVVSYDSLLENWRLESSRISRLIGVEWPNTVAQISGDVDEFLDKGRRHHISGGDSESSEPEWIDSLYEAFYTASTENGGDWAEIAAMEKQFEEISGVFDNYLNELFNRLGVSDKRLSELAGIESIIAPLNRQVADASNVVANLVETVNKQSLEISTLVDGIVTLTEGDAGVVRSLVDSQKQRIADLEGGVFERERLIAELRQSVATVIEQRKQDGAIKLERDRLAGECEQLRQDLAAMSAEVGKMKGDKADLESRSRKLREEHDVVRAALEAQLSVSTQAHTATEEKLSATAEKLSETAEKLSITELTVVELRAYIESNKPWYRKYMEKRK